MRRECAGVIMKLRILLVDDDAQIGPLMAEMLADMGHVVTGSETTEAVAVAAARRTVPDLMIVDARLGAGSGFAAVAAIRLGAAIPYILMSGDRLPHAAVPYVKLQKPFNVSDLSAAIAAALALAVSSAPAGPE